MLLSDAQIENLVVKRAENIQEAKDWWKNADVDVHNKCVRWKWMELAGTGC